MMPDETPRPMSEQPKCALCGEPMPPGEEMFKYHGYSGNCPKPPLPKADVVCAAFQDVHRWPAECASGDSCQCGGWYLIRNADGSTEIRRE